MFGGDQALQGSFQLRYLMANLFIIQQPFDVAQGKGMLLMKYSLAYIYRKP